MSDHEMARKHIDQLENRLASLHDLGVDTAALRSQLAFARTQVNENHIAEALSICEEVADTARRLADGSAQPPERPRTGRFTRDQLAEAVKDLLSQGLLAKLMAEQRSAPDVRLEARLNALDERLRNYVGQEADALRAEQQALRQDFDQVRRQVAAGGASLSASSTPITTPSGEEPAWSRALGDALRAVVERLPSASAAAADGAAEPAWASRLSTTLEAVAQRLEALPNGGTGEAVEPSWSQALSESLRTMSAHLAALPVASTPAATSAVVETVEPSWSQALSESLRAVVSHLAELPPPAAAPISPAVPEEPAWSQALGTTLQAVVQRLESVPTAAFSAESGTAEPAAEPSWSQALSETLRNIASRVDSPSVSAAASAASAEEPTWAQALRDSLSAITKRLTDQPQAVVAEQSVTSEPSWAITLREALGAAEVRHQELLAMLAAQNARPATDTGMADQVAGALERGLHDLGALLAQRPVPSSEPQDDSRVALSPMTGLVAEHVTTHSVASTSTRTDRVVVPTALDTEQIHRMIESALEAHLGARSTAAQGRPESGTEQIRALVAAEIDVRQGGALDRTSRSDVVDFRATLLRLLPDLLGDEAVRQKLFAVLALEAISKPGALGELTGLRHFLKRELSRAAEELSGKLQVA